MDEKFCIKCEGNFNHFQCLQLQFNVLSHHHWHEHVKIVGCYNWFQKHLRDVENGWIYIEVKQPALSGWALVYDRWLSRPPSVSLVVSHCPGKKHSTSHWPNQMTIYWPIASANHSTELFVHSLITFCRVRHNTYVWFSLEHWKWRVQEGQDCVNWPRERCSMNWLTGITQRSLRKNSMKESKICRSFFGSVVALRGIFGFCGFYIYDCIWIVMKANLLCWS